MKKQRQMFYNYKNIGTILNGKSNYLKNLEKRRNEGLKKIKQRKNEIFLEDYFHLNKFQRDYSCFSFDTLQDNTNTVKFHISQNINIHYPMKIEKDFSRNADDFPLKKIKKVNNSNTNDKIFPKRKIPFNYYKNTIKRRKSLANIGNQIISQSTMK